MELATPDGGHLEGSLRVAGVHGPVRMWTPQNVDARGDVIVFVHAEDAELTF